MCFMAHTSVTIMWMMDVVNMHSHVGIIDD